jgi:hypothetical protein
MCGPKRIKTIDDVHEKTELREERKDVTLTLFPEKTV